MNQPAALLDATHRAAEAASGGDLDALREALDQRGRAMASASAVECAAALAHGAAVSALLTALRRRILLEKHLLEKHSLEKDLLDSAPQPASCVDLRA